ncbi:MAG TPA: hypothetical protein PKY77_05690 [Phycisphaerae bacterium]|nr:hypothetical protein [Phycisphaerae bacterium]HRY69064.1 hypothetical protein [Phycisphaerae bacterium]HSA25961.1 hypothetical protein [Phycisphaerae bacterium]
MADDPGRGKGEKRAGKGGKLLKPEERELLIQFALSADIMAAKPYQAATQVMNESRKYGDPKTTVSRRQATGYIGSARLRLRAHYRELEPFLADQVLHKVRDAYSFCKANANKAIGVDKLRDACNCMKLVLRAIEIEQKIVPPISTAVADGGTPAEIRFAVVSDDFRPDEDGGDT